MDDEQILIVDDNPINVKLTKTLLATAGFGCSVAASAEEALGMLRSFQPRLVLTDVNLPGMDGLELTRRLRESQRWKALPIIALTANDAPEDEARLRQAGCDGYLSKPVDGKALVDLVRNYVDSGPGEDTSLDGLCRQFIEQTEQECRRMLRQMPPNENGRLVTPLLDTREAGGILHQWAGLGSTFGFPEVTSLSREAEALLAGPFQENAPRLRRILGEILERITSAVPPRFERVQAPPDIDHTLEGQRFGLLNFEVPAIQDLAAALRSAGAFYGEITWSAGMEPRSFRVYDILICGLPAGHPVQPAMLRAVLESGKPRLFTGEAETARGLGLLEANPIQGFVAEPWTVDQLLSEGQKLIAIHSVLTAISSRGVFRKPSVLIGDDDPIVRSLIRNTLEESGFTCRMAENGRMALAMARNDPPDAIILDVNMPRMDGFEVLSSLRLLQTTRDTRIILLTGRQDKHDIVRGVALGADAYVVKPFNCRELVTRLIKLLKEPRQPFKKD